MDSAQKRAILAILGMIESGIVQLKMLLSSDGPDSHVLGETQKPSAVPTQLSDEEDALLERQLELDRLALIRFEQDRANALWQRPSQPTSTLLGDDEE